MKRLELVPKEINNGLGAYVSDQRVLACRGRVGTRRHMKLLHNTFNGLSMLTGHPVFDICAHFRQNTQSPSTHCKVVLQFRLACTPEFNKHLAHVAITGRGLFIAAIIIRAVLLVRVNLTSIKNKQERKVLAS